VALRALVAVGVLAVLSSGCARLMPTKVPIGTELYPAVPGRQAETLWVLLPGRGDPVTSFADHGFVGDARAAGVAADMVAVDAHAGYYAKNTIVERVWADVLAPARARGYRHIWLVGISLGGLGALSVVREHSDGVEGVLLIAPYLGPEDLIGEIEAAGGPARWHAADPGQGFPRLWTWLAGHGDAGARFPPPFSPLLLGFGAGDRYVGGQRLLAGLLPADRVVVIPGGHDWSTWRQLWRRTFPLTRGR